LANEKLKDHYDRKYAHESRIATIEPIRLVHVPTTRFEAVIRIFPDYFRGGKILELGAGSGNVAKALLSSNLEITQYTASEISRPRLKGLRNGLHDNRVRIAEFDAENIPANEQGQYDAVLMIALIEHLIDPMGAMQRLKHVLKPGGFIYIDTPNIAKYTRRMKLLFGRFPSTGSMNEGFTTYSGEQVDLHDEGHLHYFTYRSLGLMLTHRCGFTKVVNKGYHVGKTPLGTRLHDLLANLWPNLFSELVVLAYS
jgi:SAM-dependent methyltransferase